MLTNYFGDQLIAWWNGCNYRIRLLEGNFITVRLGEVKQKNDGRWEWIIRPDRNGFYRPTKPFEKLQGVCSTIEEAKRKVEEAWI